MQVSACQAALLQHFSSLLDVLSFLGTGDWQSLLDLPAPPSDARGVTTLGGSQYASAVHFAGRALAMAARAPGGPATGAGLGGGHGLRLGQEVTVRPLMFTCRQLDSQLGLRWNAWSFQQHCNSGCVGSGHR